jgi:hypothetical protein
MSKDSKKAGPLQLRVPRDEKRGAELAARLEKIAETNGLSINSLANLCLAAGLPIVEPKLRDLHEHEQAAA